MFLNEEYLFLLKLFYDLPFQFKLVLGALEGPILVQCIPCTDRLSNYCCIFCKSSFTHAPE